MRGGNYINSIKKCIVLSLVFSIVKLVGCTSISTTFKEDYKFKRGSDISFYIVTDLHYLSSSLTDYGEAFNKFISSGDGKQLEYIDEILNTFVNNIKNTTPDVLIISGDLTNNGEKKSHLELAKKLKSIKESGTSVYVIPGNHDISNNWAREFKGNKQHFTKTISEKDFSKIYADFGYNQAILKDKHTLSYLAPLSEDIWLLMLDTNKNKHFPKTIGELSKDTLNWVKKCGTLARERDAKIITVMHHSILNHSDVVQDGYTLNNNEEVLDIFRDNKLNLVLSGHIHVQDIASDNRGEDKLYDIATSSLAVYPHQYGILKYSCKDNSLDYSTARVDVEAWSTDKGIADEKLNNFTKYSKEYFGKFSYDMAYKQLKDDKSYSEDEIKLMCETMKILNLRYFSGVENLNSKDIINSEGYKLLLNSSEGFLKDYVLSVSSDKDTDDNNLHIKISGI